MHYYLGAASECLARPACSKLYLHGINTQFLHWEHQLLQISWRLNRDLRHSHPLVHFPPDFSPRLHGDLRPGWVVAPLHVEGDDGDGNDEEPSLV